MLLTFPNKKKQKYKNVITNNQINKDKKQPYHLNFHIQFWGLEIILSKT